MLNCAVIGATGYTGIELIKILLRHRYARISALTTRQQESFSVQKLIPTLPKDVDLKVKAHSFSELKRSSDLFFLCLPHTKAMETAAKLRKADKIVIDLSADFRLKDARVYEKWYKAKHKNPALLKEAVYGLPEFYRRQIRGAHFIANPGCYPTSIALTVAPLLSKRLVDPLNIAIDSKSGVSGAGKKLSSGTQYYELDENFYAYKVGVHQHTPEIAQTLTSFSTGKVDFSFVTHLLPLRRGILSTVHMKAAKGATAAKIANAFAEAYSKEPFVRVKEPDTFPQLKDVRHTNYCDIGFHFNQKSRRVIVVSAIDNLLKGASGQAVQNMNVCMSFPEEEGINTW